ncbi:hypothetical protein [Actinacidiphila acidipaludis]|uniref:WD40 repeat domain-containing protein n=1 Tax=Actinacidiphila acidipaludis TaxID=2873382 RepID=A0ABS7QI53_9ACTN|nr:hypothetical protein [Streptomyces acidipaludis]MBY8882466.1 hypothetical protein [Streptomyces acidipaludis]
MRPSLPVAAACAALALACGPAATAVADSGPSVAFRMSDPRIIESSGLAASRLHPGVYWTHNDSGDGPYVYAVDSATGKTLARVTMRGVPARDMEAISLGPDGDLYLGDIGDNLGGKWPEVWIYRFAEPKQLRDQTVDVTRFTVRYSDGPRNAEALMVHPKTGRVYIASKNEDGGHLYAGPAELSTHGINIFKPIADVPWVTDGAFSPDGTRLVLRGYFWSADYRWTNGAPHKIGDLDVPMQPQGEGVTFTTDGRALMYSSEGTDSQVWKASLSGADLPDSAAASSSTTASGHGQEGASAESGTKNPGTGHKANKVVGLAVLAAFGGLGYLASKGLRRRRHRQ